MTKEEIVKVLANARAKAESDYRIAKDSKLAPQQVKGIYTGTINPTLTTLLAYCDAVGLTILIEASK